MNLEEPGEHPYCGDGIIPRTGFAYTPETLMNAGIQYYNLYWKDLQVPDHQRVLQIVQIMHHVVVQGGLERRNKILVHCHAGQGRTAIVIGAYLLYASLAKDAEEAVAICRRGRRKLFSHAYNRSYLRGFESELKVLRMLCPGVGGAGGPVRLEDLLLKQRRILQGQDAATHRHMPKVINESVQALKRLLLLNKGSNPKAPLTAADLEDSILLPLHSPPELPALLMVPHLRPVPKPSPLVASGQEPAQGQQGIATATSYKSTPPVNDAGSYPGKTTSIPSASEQAAKSFDTAEATKAGSAASARARPNGSQQQPTAPPGLSNGAAADVNGGGPSPTGAPCDNADEAERARDGPLLDGTADVANGPGGGDQASMEHVDDEATEAERVVHQLL